jgi:hypothetical protein
MGMESPKTAARLMTPTVQAAVGFGRQFVTANLRGMTLLWRVQMILKALIRQALYPPSCMAGARVSFDPNW